MSQPFRPGYESVEGWDGLIRQCEWSDRFFNYVPAEQTYDDEDILLESAVQFIEVNDDCPYTAEYLVKDFYRRL